MAYLYDSRDKDEKRILRILTNIDEGCTPCKLKQYGDELETLLGKWPTLEAEYAPLYDFFKEKIPDTFSDEL